MAVHNAVLSQTPEFREQKLRTFESAVNVYDQLAVFLARWGQLRLFHECLESGAFKFSFEEPHMWQQFALSLLAIGEHAHAVRVLNEVHRMSVNNIVPCLLTIKACYLHLQDHDEGIKWSLRALELKEGAAYGIYSARAHLFLGIGYHMKALSSPKFCKEFNAKAIETIQRAQQMSTSDHLIHHHLAVVLAHNRRLTEAKVSIKQALNLRPEYVPSLYLLALLLTAQKQNHDALRLVVQSLEEWPDSLDLMMLEAHLEHLLSGPEAGKIVANRMLVKWKIIYEDKMYGKENNNNSERRSESRSIFQLSEAGSTTVQIRTFGAMSESSLSSLPRQKSSGPQWDWLVKIWLLMAELCLHAGQRDQAIKCIDEAQLVQPMTPDVLVARGIACEADGLHADAKNYYESAIALQPDHLNGLQHLGKIYYILGNFSMAEFFLLKAARINPAEYETWYVLGLALEAQKNYVGSADAMTVALDVETTSPLLPFSTVPMTLE